jgi:hypothetical protein
MKVIPETWRIWWRLFQKRDVSDEGYSRKVMYLMKVIPETWRIWRRLYVTFLEWSSSNTSRFWNNLHQMRHVSWMTFIRYLTFLDWNILHPQMKIITETGHTRSRLLQKQVVSDEGYSRNVTYLMKVILEMCRIWWRLFQKNLHQTRQASGVFFIKYVTFLE